MTTVIKVKASSPAVIEFQKVNAVVNRKIQEAGSNKAYWTGYYNQRSNEIAAQYGISVSDLVDAWVSWVDAVEQARKGGK
jgi:hypothetical protein